MSSTVPSETTAFFSQSSRATTSPPSNAATIIVHSPAITLSPPQPPVSTGTGAVITHSLVETLPQQFPSTPPEAFSSFSTTSVAESIARHSSVTPPIQSSLDQGQGMPSMPSAPAQGEASTPKEPFPQLQDSPVSVATGGAFAVLTLPHGPTPLTLTARETTEILPGGSSRTEVVFGSYTTIPVGYVGFVGGQSVRVASNGIVVGGSSTVFFSSRASAVTTDRARLSSGTLVLSTASKTPSSVRALATGNGGESLVDSSQHAFVVAGLLAWAISS